MKKIEELEFQYYYELADCMLQLKKLDEAEKYLEEATKLLKNQNNENLLTALATLEYEKNNIKKAFNFIKEGLKLNNDHFPLINILIKVCYKLKNFEFLEKCLKEYLLLHPGNININFYLAKCLFIQKKYKEALDYIDKILIFDTENSEVNQLKKEIIEKINN